MPSTVRTHARGARVRAQLFHNCYEVLRAARAAVAVVTTAPPSAHNTYASHGTPITSVCSASANTATSAPPSQAVHGTTSRSSASDHAMKSSAPAIPASIPSSVYVDSPASIGTPVRAAVEPALPTP